MIAGYFLTLLTLWVIALSLYLVLCIKQEGLLHFRDLSKAFSREMKYEPAEIIGGTLVMICGIGLMHWGIIEAAIAYPRGAVGAGFALATIAVIIVVSLHMKKEEGPSDG